MSKGLHCSKCHRPTKELYSPDWTCGIAAVFDVQARWYYHGQGREQVGCPASKLRLALEAAAANGGNNVES